MSDSVSVVIPARTWDAHLDGALRSIADQVVPPGTTIETLVALAEAPPAVVPDGVTVLVNPSGTIPDGLNLAIAASTGAIVVRVDARCDLPPDYVATVCERLRDPAIGSVGGAQLVLDRGQLGSAYAVAFNSPLLGPSVYRYGRRSGPVSSPYLGAWRRSTLDELGGFDPTLIRNQDNELADRVQRSGRSVWYDADLVVGYRNDRTLRGTIAHHHEFGLWRMIQAGQGQRGLTPRHIVALLGVAGAGGLGLAALRSPRTRRLTLAAATVAHLAAGASAHRTASRLRRARPDIEGAPIQPSAVLLAPTLAVVLDGAWVAGLVRGALRNRRGSSGSAKPVPAPH